jgi:hypothetical protein
MGKQQMNEAFWHSPVAVVEEPFDLEATMPETPFARRCAAFRDERVVVVAAYDPWRDLPLARADHQRRARLPASAVFSIERLLALVVGFAFGIGVVLLLAA